jgi:hypothetical protein
MYSEMPKIPTMSLDEATVIRAAGHDVIVTKKACSVRALFELPDTAEVRELLRKYSNREVLPIPTRSLLVARADLYREARSARGGL